MFFRTSHWSFFFFIFALLFSLLLNGCIGNTKKEPSPLLHENTQSFASNDILTILKENSVEGEISTYGFYYFPKVKFSAIDYLASHEGARATGRYSAKSAHKIITSELISWLESHDRLRYYLFNNWKRIGVMPPDYRFFDKIKRAIQEELSDNGSDKKFSDIPEFLIKAQILAKNGQKFAIQFMQYTRDENFGVAFIFNEKIIDFTFSQAKLNMKDFFMNDKYIKEEVAKLEGFISRQFGNPASATDMLKLFNACFDGKASASRWDNLPVVSVKKTNTTWVVDVGNRDGKVDRITMKKDNNNRPVSFKVEDGGYYKLPGS